MDEMATELIIEKIFIECQVCGNEFWYIWENEKQECPWCGQRNYRQAILLTAKRNND